MLNQETQRHMKAVCNWMGVLSVICSLGFVSCDVNDGIELIDPSYKTLNLSGGGDVEIPVLTNDWYIESVQYLPSNEAMLDKDGLPLTLPGNGIIEASNGWLTLTRVGDDAFVIVLKENFDTSRERAFAIYINNGSHRDYITIAQQAGTEYRLVKSEYEEIEEQRTIYQSDEGCTPITVSNDTPEGVWEPTGYIFEDVVESSNFESDVYGAFEWTQGKEIEISMPELIIDGAIYGSNMCEYAEGITTTPYRKDIPNGDKILVQPHSTVHVRGEITYCKRVYNYIFTIQNISSGTRFEIMGVWTHIVPITKHMIVG
jgi:hypothetical protein